MSKLKSLSYILLGAVAALFASCSDSESYAELLTDETKATNAFLADHVVVNAVPEDTVFVTCEEAGDLAPYYRLDEDGDVYMQVVKLGTPGNMAQTDQVIYLRFMRYDLFYYEDGELGTGSGNDEDLTYGTASFRFDNYEATSSYEWGTGIQLPLKYVPIDTEVNIVIKSQSGMYTEIANVQPYLYEVHYFKAQI